MVESVSRLARDRIDALSVREELRAHGVEVRALDDGLVDPGSTGGRFLTGIRELTAEMESSQTGERVKRGCEGRTRQGWMTGRKTPFGYQRVAVYSADHKDADGRPLREGVRLEPDSATAPIVQHIFRRYAGGLGLRRIADELNDETGPYRAAKPKGYQTSFLRDLLLNPVYRGCMVYGRTREVKVRVHGVVQRRKEKVDPKDWTVTPDAHEALVDEATWRAVQARFEKNRGRAFGRGVRVAGRGRRPASLLTGLVKCAACSKNYVVWTSGPNTKQKRKGTGKTQRRLVCGQKKQKLCDNGMTVDAERLERAVLDAIEDRVLTEAGIEYLESRRREALEQALRAKDGRTAELRREWSRIEEEEKRLIEAIRQGVKIPGLLDASERLAEQRGRIAGEVERIERLESLRNSRLDTHLAKRRFRHLRDVLDAPDLDGVRRTLKDVIVGVEARTDGSFWLLVGEGPLGTEDLGLLRETAAVPKARRPRPGPESPRSGSRICMVGATGFEPATSCSRSRRATKLRYAPCGDEGERVPGRRPGATGLRCCARGGGQG